jgi:hypothetical protein
MNTPEQVESVDTIEDLERRLQEAIKWFEKLDEWYGKPWWQRLLTKQPN